MADTKAPGGQQPRPGQPEPRTPSMFQSFWHYSPLPKKPEPRTPSSPVNPFDAEDLVAAPVDFGAAPVGFRAAPAKRQPKSWLQQNRGLAIGMAVGGLALVLLVILGWQFGWFGGGAPARPQGPSQPIAVAPTPPPAPPPVPTDPHMQSDLIESWVADPIFDGQLGFYQTVEGYELRVPNGYETTQIPVPPPPGGKVFSWAGPAGNDGTRPLLGVVLVTPPPGQQANVGLGLIIQQIRPPADKCSDWTQAAAEQGLLGGLYALRTSCQGTMSTPAGEAALRWSVYLCQHGSVYIFLVTADAVAHQGDSLRIANAAIMTFRKKDAGAQSGSANPAPPDDLPEWRPGDAAEAELAAYQEVGDYRVRLPKGYEPLKDPPVGPPEGQVWAFGGPARPDHSRPTLTFTFVKLRPEVAAARLDNAILTVLGAAPKSGSASMSGKSLPGKIEWGRVGDLSFVRSRLDVAETPSHAKVQTFLYVCRDSGNLIAIRASDIEPHNRQTLKLCNAAALTFQRK